MVGPSEGCAEDGALFSGEHWHRLDEKGRLTLPAAFRPLVGEVAYVARGLDGCLFVYPERQWLAMVRAVGALSLADPRGRLLKRMVLASNRCTVDGAGRILIPAALRAYACITEEAVIAGVGDRIEVWAPERWNAVMSQLQDAFSGPDAFRPDSVLP
jgi:MraZ protein